MDSLLYVLVWGFINGSIYLGLALGFSIVVGVLRIFHLGYGMFMVLSIYLTWALWRDLGLALWVAGLLSLLFSAVVSMVIYPVVRRFAEAEDYLLLSLVLIFLLSEEVINIIYPPDRGVNIPTKVSWEYVSLGGVQVSLQYIFLSLFSLSLFMIYVFLVKYTRLGLLMRAISQDLDTSRLMGVRPLGIYLASLGLAVIPTSALMLFYAPIVGITPFMGLGYFVYALQVAILGGLGNLRGTLMAAYVIGYTHAAVGFLVDPRAMNLASLVVTILILLAKPRGLARAEGIW